MVPASTAGEERMVMASQHPKFVAKGKGGLEGLRVKMEGKLTFSKNIYAWIFKLRFSQFVALIVGVPIALSLIFTPIYLMFPESMLFDCDKFRSTNAEMMCQGHLDCQAVNYQVPSIFDSPKTAFSPLETTRSVEDSKPRIVAESGIDELRNAHANARSEGNGIEREVQSSAVERTGLVVSSDYGSVRNPSQLGFNVTDEAPVSDAPVQRSYHPACANMVVHVFLFSLSLSTTFGGSPLAPHSPFLVFVANLNTLLAQLVFVFISGAVFSRLARPSFAIECSKKLMISAPPDKRDELTNNGKFPPSPSLSLLKQEASRPPTAQKANDTRESFSSASPLFSPSRSSTLVFPSSSSSMSSSSTSVSSSLSSHFLSSHSPASPSSSSLASLAALARVSEGRRGGNISERVDGGTDDKSEEECESESAGGNVSETGREIEGEKERKFEVDSEGQIQGEYGGDEERESDFSSNFSRKIELSAALCSMNPVSEEGRRDEERRGEERGSGGQEGDRSVEEVWRTGTNSREKGEEQGEEESEIPDSGGAEPLEERDTVKDENDETTLAGRVLSARFVLTGGKFHEMVAVKLSLTFRIFVLTSAASAPSYSRSRNSSFGSGVQNSFRTNSGRSKLGRDESAEERSVSDDKDLKDGKGLCGNKEAPSVFCHVEELKLIRDCIPRLKYGFVVRHVVDEDSPLFDLTLKDLRGGDASLSLTIHAVERSSMQPVFQKKDYYIFDNDILFNKRFADLVIPRDSIEETSRSVSTNSLNVKSTEREPLLKLCKIFERFYFLAQRISGLLFRPVEYRSEIPDGAGLVMDFSRLNEYLDDQP